MKVDDQTQDNNISQITIKQNEPGEQYTQTMFAYRVNISSCFCRKIFRGPFPFLW